MDEHVHASVNGVETFHPETGHYATLHYTGCPTRERAMEIRQGLYRSARRMGVSLMVKVEKAADGTFTVIYTAINKEHGKAYVLKTYGPDVTKWAYSPRKGDSNYGNS